MSDSSKGSNVVLCCCDSDADFCRALSPGLDALRDEQVIAGWREHRVTNQSATDVLDGDSFQVVLALLSPEFLATGFLESEEFLARMNQPRPAKLAVVPVLARPVTSTHRTLNHSVLPPIDARALSEVDNVDAAVRQIMEHLRVVAQSNAETLAAPDTMDRTIRLAKDEDDSASSASSAPPAKASAPSDEGAAGTVDRIGRYRILSVLGEGAFGAVYLARDEQLDRSVAIKTPHRRRLNRPGDVETYMREARVVARLDHPGIVPVYDVGQTGEGQFYVVSKVIEGKDLSKRLRAARPSLIEAARLVALTAEALHYAHQHDLVHRDVKPANILIGDADGRPYVADFGLAIHEDELGRGPTRAGTPAYMSPEQARGEGHRVDGRSDVFSLGVVLYELITGRLPFRQQNIEELLAQIAKSEARPPRQIDASIPRELERICLRAMSNRIMDRYTTAQDFADDLWAFINSGPTLQSSGLRSSVAEGSMRDTGGTPPAAASGWAHAGPTESARRSTSSGGRGSTSSSRKGLATPTASGTAAHGAPSRSTRSGATTSTLSSASRAGDDAAPAKVIAKGLRSFDDHDAEFFLELVPGPRDRFGLPDSIRFWKSRLEETNADKTFPVGVIYGPSGCGKTSLVRAGLLPQLSPHVHVLFLDASGRDFETRLAQRVKNLCSDASPTANLPDLMAWIRRGRGIPWESKLVIVIDQFEQWLQVHENDRNSELLDALRQCDGARVQCLLMVRVDFMMSIHRFMNDLETPIQEGSNSAAVDLFDAMHARKVLRLFGESYGRLPEEPQPLDAGAEAFLDAAVAELGAEGKVVPVQLALFADMCKGRPWCSETLKQLGGARGIGVTFLEETFNAATAPLEHRVHQKACRAMLQRLLPDPGRQIRGQARTRDELARAAGYGPTSSEIDAALGVLDRNTRLITPVEREAGDPPPAGDAPPPEAPAALYQLTHDYLVPSLREWTTKKQRETARGRAELRLDEFARLWNDKPTPRRLPGFADWLSIRTRTDKTQWTEPQRRMMAAAGRRVGMTSAIAASLFAALGLAVWGVTRRLESQRVAAVVDQLATADMSATRDIVAQLAPVRNAAAPLLLTRYAAADAPPQSRLNAALAALSLDAGGADADRMVDDVYSSMLVAAPDDLAAMVQCLGDEGAPCGARAADELASAANSAKILPLASLVSIYRPQAKWTPALQDAVASQLVAAPADEIGGWTRALHPLGAQLAGPLQTILQDQQRAAPQRNAAGDLLVALLPDEDRARVQGLVDVMEHASGPQQFQRAASQLEQFAAAAVPLIGQRRADLSKLAAGAMGVEREAIGRREMHLAAGALLLDESGDAWKAFEHSPDPTVRSLLIENAAALGLPPSAIFERLKSESNASVRRALVLSLGSYSKDQLAPLDLSDIARLLGEWRNSEDAGLHAGATWLLDRWVAERLVAEAPPAAARDENSAMAAANELPSWYATSQRQEMIVVRGPVTFQMGSAENDPDREGGAFDETELRHPVRIGRSFAVASTEVTLGQFRLAWADLKGREEFRGADGGVRDEFPYHADKAPDDRCPAINVDWFMAAAYCNWLSQREGIPSDQWVYDDSYGFRPRMVLPENYLARTGYRLPTEAEWEMACRSGTTSSRFFGEAPSLLVGYGRCPVNGTRPRSTSPVATLKPNEFGLFDVYGNVSEWCMEEPRAYGPGVYDDVEVGRMQRFVNQERVRAHRGGAFQYVPEMVTSAARDRSDPDYPYFSLGFRVARTMTADPAAEPSTDSGAPSEVASR